MIQERIPTIWYIARVVVHTAVRSVARSNIADASKHREQLSIDTEIFAVYEVLVSWAEPDWKIPAVTHRVHFAARRSQTGPEEDL